MKEEKALPVEYQLINADTMMVRNIIQSMEKSSLRQESSMNTKSIG